ncbi:RNA 2',3'-cyclic phosphodiesterase [Salmonella enterica subsp. enterica serovar Choleraesuis]|nr:RNA 2',3'-cyclic phosphodiesterase [Salmonella enterica subsp. enterica serovar Choleraesuis]
MSATRRLFFGLELPSALQKEIIGWRAEQFAPDAGIPVAAASLHITLAFLGEVSAQKQAALMAQAGRIRQPSFTLNLNDAGHWPRSRVVWLGSNSPPRGLLQLASMLRAQAARSGCPQPYGAFHPHVTLYRQAPSDVSLPAPGFCWHHEVEEFVLFESGASGGRTRYRTLARWPLTSSRPSET